MAANLIYWDDWIETWIKLNQRGMKFIRSKFNLSGKQRTISSFSHGFEHANWWIIPALKERTNFLISGDSKINYEQYLTKNYFKNDGTETLVSYGCGIGSHETLLAELNPQLRIKAYDISEELINNAKQNAQQKGLNNIEFINEDVYQLKIQENSVDYYLFNASLHHFSEIEKFVGQKLYPTLKKNGLIIINEYVGPNRMNFPKKQIAYSNRCLREVISKENRKILGLNAYKTRCYRLGNLRMKLSDPSECVDSESILPVLRKYFEELEFKKLGGNILVPVLKHIAHHFVNKNQNELEELIRREETYLLNNASDLVFAIYKKN